MNRKSFLKKLGIGVAAIVVVPKVIAENAHDSPKRIDWNDEVGKTQRGIHFYKARRNSSVIPIEMEKPPYWDALVERYGKSMSANDFFKALEP